MIRIIEPSVEILPFTDNEVGAYKKIELCGRTAYKSESTDDSYVPFIRNIIKREHESVLEHFWCSAFSPGYDDMTHYVADIVGEGKILPYVYENEIFSTNIRGWRMLAKRFSYSLAVQAVADTYPLFFEDIDIDIDVSGRATEDTNYHTVRFICDRGISHELVRHRALSPTQESTRYCIYGGCLTVIKPCWWPDMVCGEYRSCFDFDIKHGGHAESNWFETIKNSHKTYEYLLEHGYSPQQARSVLPNSTKTEVVMTGTDRQWEEFFILRDAPSAHPQMQQLAGRLHEMFRSM